MKLTTSSQFIYLAVTIHRNFIASQKWISKRTESQKLHINLFNLLNYIIFTQGNVTKTPKWGEYIHDRWIKIQYFPDSIAKTQNPGCSRDFKKKEKRVMSIRFILRITLSWEKEKKMTKLRENLPIVATSRFLIMTIHPINDPNRRQITILLIIEYNPEGYLNAG